MRRQSARLHRHQGRHARHVALARARPRPARHSRQHAGARLDHDRKAADHLVGDTENQLIDASQALRGRVYPRRHRPHGAVPRRRRQPDDLGAGFRRRRRLGARLSVGRATRGSDRRGSGRALSLANHLAAAFSAQEGRKFPWGVAHEVFDHRRRASRPCRSAPAAPSTPIPASSSSRTPRAALSSAPAPAPSLGALAGAATGNDPRVAALIGAGIGGITGAAIGNYMDQQEAELRAQLQGTGVSVTRVGNQIILNMPSNITFGVDSATGAAGLQRDAGRRSAWC